MDELLCSCCCEPIYVEPESWAYESASPDPYQVAYAEMTYAEPVYVDPVYVDPAYVEPVYVAPAPAPVYDVPAYVEPVYVEPAVFAPVYEAPAYVEPVSLVPQTADIGGWDQGWTVVAPTAAVGPQTVLANVPGISTASDPGLSLSEALGSPTFGGNPWDTSVYQVYNQSLAAYPTSVAAPGWTAYTDPLINGALVANELALYTIRNASRPLS